MKIDSWRAKSKTKLDFAEYKILKEQLKKIMKQLANSGEFETEKIRIGAETLFLVDRLMEENDALRKELYRKTKQLRILQKAVHQFLTGDDEEGKAAAMVQASQGEHNGL